ncbi:MAG: response regulator [Gemmatimonadota bacterium]
MAKVLVVDDNADERRIFTTTLYYNGFDVSEAASGSEAIAVARTFVPDVIVMDIKLPDMNGFIATDIIRAILELDEVPVICITGLDLTAGEARARGCVELLTKPVEPHVLVSAVRRNLAAPPLS